MSKPSKFFRVATEGATTDGRNIDRATIAQIAATYTPKTYGARIGLEHIRGILPDSQFKAYGDVIAVKAEEVDTDSGKKLALFAQIEPTPELVDEAPGNGPRRPAATGNDGAVQTEF